MSRETDIAWAAGLFEGEGCISISSSAARKIQTPRVALVSTDLDVLERFMAIMGVGGIYPVKRRETHLRPQHMWVANKGLHFQHVLNLLKPYLGVRRTARAIEIGEAHQKQVDEYLRARPCPTCGRLFKPVDTYFKNGRGHSPKRYCGMKCHPSRQRDVVNERARRYRAKRKQQEAA